MSDIIYVGMAQFKVVGRPDKIETQALGSCVGTVLFDQSTGMGGISHAMLPDVNEAKETSRGNLGKFVNTAVPKLLDEMLERGANRILIRAKLAGGANMFPDISRGGAPHIGQRNVSAAKKALAELRIPIVADETGGVYGRTIILDTMTGLLNVRSVFHGEKEV